MGGRGGAEFLTEKAFRPNTKVIILTRAKSGVPAGHLHHAGGDLVPPLLHDPLHLLLLAYQGP